MRDRGPLHRLCTERLIKLSFSTTLGILGGTCLFVSTLCVLGRELVVILGGGSCPGLAWCSCLVLKWALSSLGLSFPRLLVCSHGASGLGRPSLDSQCSVILMVHIGGCFTILTELGVDGVVTLAALLTLGG